VSELRLALSIISGRKDPETLSDSDYRNLGFRHDQHPDGLEPSYWVEKDDVLEVAEKIVGDRLEELQKDLDSKGCAHIHRTFGTCDGCGLMGL